jgi:hypothetical protein
VERLGREIREELARFGPQGGMPELVSAWPEAVGPMVAANAWPARMTRDGTLQVHTSSSTWAFELGHLAPAILEKLRSALGEDAPKAMKFVPGHLPEADAPEVAEARSEVPEPSEEARQEAASLAAEIEDENLRKLVEKAAALGLSRAPSDHRF